MKLNDVLQNMEYSRFTGHAGAAVTGFCLDSRSLKKAEVFICLDGRRHKGVDFIPEAVRKKASAVIVDARYAKETQKFAGLCGVILVPDVMAAIRECARFWKSRFSVTTVAVTGSNGKTTTKELIAAILSRKFSVLRNERNFNNEIGVPLTLFRLNKSHQVLVIELGISKPGEMARLASMVRPEYAVITNIGSSHLEFLKTEPGVAREKSHLLDYTSKAVFLNQHNRFRDLLRRRGLARVTVHPFRRLADHRFDSAEPKGYDGWTVRCAGRRMDFSLYGEYNLDNLAMAIAVCRSLGVGAEDIAKAVSGFRDIGSRASVLKSGNVTVVDESYNANYSSLSRSIRFLSKVRTDGDKAAVIGEMKELGRRSRFLHGLIGTELTRTKIGRIVLTGHEARHIRRTCYPKSRVVWCANRRELAKEALALRTGRRPLTVLVKGSRSNRLDEVVDILKKKWRLE